MGKGRFLGSIWSEKNIQSITARASETVSAAYASTTTGPAWTATTGEDISRLVYATKAAASTRTTRAVGKGATTHNDRSGSLSAAQAASARTADDATTTTHVRRTARVFHKQESTIHAQ